jgi:AcrR family transcriptional regulator
VVLVTGLRERKKAETRRALSDAALQLALERGVDGVTREAIAELAGVSLRTFTNYFAGKYEAVGYRIAERMRRSVAAFRSRPTEEPLWTAITEAVTGTLEDDFADITGAGRIADRHELAEVRKLLLEAGVRSAIPRELHDDWVSAIAERTDTDPGRDMYPHLVAAVVRAVGDVAMESYTSADEPAPLVDLMRAGFAAVAAGLPLPDRNEGIR